MATGTTYNTLVESLQRYCERATAVDDLTYAELPKIINRAERILGREVKAQLMCIPAVATMVSSTNVYQKPDRWRETISINFGLSNTRSPLFPRSYEYIRTVFPDDTVTGTPQFYADYDLTHILVAPTPDRAYSFELNYYQVPAYLESTNQTNWWTDNAPEVLLAACMYQLVLFLKDTAEIPTWQGEYQRCVQALNGEDMEKIVDRGTTRRKP